MDYETGYLNRRMEEDSMRQNVHEERPPPPSTTTPSPAPVQTGGLPPIPEADKEEDDEDMDDDEEEEDKSVNQEESERLGITIFTGRRSTTSDVWRDGIDFASTPMNKTLADSVFEDREEERNDLRKDFKRVADPEVNKPNWGTKRRVCEGCLQDQVFSDRKPEPEELGNDEINDNPWVMVQRQRKPSQNLSQELSFKRGHFRGHKHPRESNLSKEGIESKRTYRETEATENRGTDDTQITRKTRSQGLTPEPMFPTRPLEYKNYTKRK